MSGGEGYEEQDKRILAFGKQKIAEYKAEDPQMLFCISRSKNKNLVAYEVNLVKDANGEFVKNDGQYVIDESDPVNSYWITGEESYIEDNKKNGVNDRRSDLNFIERTMAYGISAKKNSDGTYDATVVPVSKVLKISIGPNGRPIARGMLNGKDCTLTMLFVKSQERRFLPPKCIYVDVYGVTDDGEEVIERLLP